MAKVKLQTLRGMYDILPDKSQAMEYFINQFKGVVNNAGYGLISTPVLEDTSLYVRSVGNDTDIVSKEMYTLEDRSNNSITLRPEATAGIVRSFIEQGMASLPQPVKLFTIADCFRYDRPQTGRQRQFTQLGVEVFGEPNSSMDAQVIVLANRFFKKVGLTDLKLQLNSIGCNVCRPKYRLVLIDYLESNIKNLGSIDQDRVKTNPLRVLDSKEAKTQAVLKEVPQALNYLCDECQAHFSGVIEYLDLVGVDYTLNPLLVRGLDYYNRTVFEFFGSRDGSQSSIGGGGRYDSLVEELGGVKTPAVGFGVGLERLFLECESLSLLPEADSSIDVFVVSSGDAARVVAFKLIEDLLDQGISASGTIDQNSIGNQLGKASKLGAKYSIIIGQNEVDENNLIVRDMTNNAQETILSTSIIGELKKRLF